jgi:hypothetical protein
VLYFSYLVDRLTTLQVVNIITRSLTSRIELSKGFSVKIPILEASYALSPSRSFRRSRRWVILFSVPAIHSVTNALRPNSAVERAYMNNYMVSTLVAMPGEGSRSAKRKVGADSGGSIPPMF